MTQKYQVKVSMKQAAIVETGIVLKQGDFGMQLEIEVLDFDVTGTTPQIVFRKAMGAVESTTITVSGNKYTYTFKGTELDTPGKCFCDLKLKNSTTQRISTASFMFKVVADTLDGLAEESSSYSDTIEVITGRLQNNIDEVKNILSPTNPIGTVWKNGTPFNNSNPNYISTWYVIPTNGASQIEMFFNMDLSLGDKSEIYLYTFSVDSGRTDQSGGYRIRNEVLQYTTDGHVTYELQNNEKGFTFAIGRIDENGTNIPVRTSNIDTKTISLVLNNNWIVDDKIDEIREKQNQSVMNKFQVTSGTAHSSTKDTVKINISNGEKFYITIISDATYNPYFTVTQNPNEQTAQKTSIQANTGRREITANMDTAEVGLYIGAPSETFNTIFMVETENSLFQFPATWDKALDDKITSNWDKNLNYIKDPALASVNISWRNGSAFNTGNANYIAPVNIIPSMGAQRVVFFADINLNEGEKVEFELCTFSISSGITSNSGGYRIRNDITIVSESKVAVYDLYDDEKGFIIYITKQNSSGTIIPLRIANVTQSKLKMVRYYFNESPKENLKNTIEMARHIPGGIAQKPLTILHFSDIHGDVAALKRIIREANKYVDQIDEIICTGDIVANNYGNITSWWDPKVLTCIGNHDSASYSSQSGYNWTYLTMAQRSQYYIEPFEANWNIEHTEGTSYYYKDYPDSKVRLIVIDAMLYTGDDTTTEASEQTEWIGTTMDGAKELSYHVVIASHAPHGGATPVDCTFSKRGETTMPVHSSCTTPQEVVDIVASKIAAGCKFVGYLVGHTHQDDIWDCENDGKQRMYCVTCAAVAQKAQWQDSDQYRNEDMDAFNIVTIDAVGGLIKIIRGGGANKDRYMRNRKQIGFYYITGTITGQDN